MTMKWELTKTALLFSGALLGVQALVSALQLLALVH
jgi:hypothetical protein